MSSEDPALEIPNATQRTQINERRLIDGPVASTLVRFGMPLLATNTLMALSGSWGEIGRAHV